MTPGRGGDRCNAVLTVGGAAKAIAKGAQDAGYGGEVQPTADSLEASRVLLTELKAGDRVLLKASRAARLEDILIELRNAWELPGAAP